MVVSTLRSGSTGALAGLALLALLVLLLACASVLVGASDVSMLALLGAGSAPVDPMAAQLLFASRLPRTVALVLSGMAMAVAGMIMQMLARNRFVEPSTAGTVESASLGVLMVALFAPTLPLFGKMLVSAVFALGGSLLFLAILRRIPQRSSLIVPLVGLVLGGVINAATTFFAHRHDMLQTLHAWSTGDFSAVLRGRYELLWIGFGLTLLAWHTAHRFTVAGMGRDFAANLGVHHGRMVALGLLIVATVTAVVVVTSGMVPFLGLIVPNLVSLMLGDNMRRAVPWVGLLGAAFVLACDIAGRLLLHPYEVPIGTVVGMVGSALFLFLLLRTRARVG